MRPAPDVCFVRARRIACTPTEVRAALAAGADVVKVFPASCVGGPTHIKALASVLPRVAFCPPSPTEHKIFPAFTLP